MRPEDEPVRVLTRDQLLRLTAAVAKRDSNYGRPVEWIVANIQPSGLIPLYVLGVEGPGPDRFRCVVAPRRINGERGIYTIDLARREINSLRIPTDVEARGLVREFIDYIPGIPLTTDQQAEWQRARR